MADPRWFGPSGYRIAYRSGDDLRVVAGDGTGDHGLAAAVAKVAPAWRPGHAYELAYVSKRRAVIVRDADSGHVAWTATAGTRTDQLAWSADGQYLLAFSTTAVRIYNSAGALVSIVRVPTGERLVDGALSPDGRTVALVLGGSSSEVVLENATSSTSTSRRVLAGAGLDQVSWSPDGHWLLVSWPAANQWVFVRVAGRPRITAVWLVLHQRGSAVRADVADAYHGRASASRRSGRRSAQAMCQLRRRRRNAAKRHRGMQGASGPPRHRS